MEALLLTLTQFGILFFFIIIGYMLMRFKILADVKGLSALLMWVFIPAVVFNVFYRNLSPANIASALPYLAAGLIMLAVTIAVAIPIAKRYKDRITRNTVIYSLVVTNMSYVGFPLMQNVMPELYLFFMVFITGYQIFIFTVGAAMFRPEGKMGLKGLISPILIALAAGVVCGLAFGAAGKRLPAIIENIVDSAAACMSPLAMIITGFTLARLPLKKALASADTYLFAALRLIVFPLTFGGITYLLQYAIGFDIGIVKVAIIYLSLPAGINTVVFAEAGGGDGTFGARLAFVSHLFSVVTLPLIFALVSIL